MGHRPIVPFPFAMEALKEEKVTLRTESEPVRDFMSVAEQEAVTIEEVIHLDTILESGQLQATSEQGSALYVTNVNPVYLESNGFTRISYLARLFRFWRGNLLFRLIVTKAIFQQCKLLMVFVPGVDAAGLRSMPLATLYGAQTRAVVNPENDVIGELEVPFVFESLWAPMEDSIGAFGVFLLTPIVVTQQSNSTIPWILSVSSPRGVRKLSFRYTILPVTESQQVKQEQLGAIYAESNSLGQVARATTEGKLVIRDSFGGSPRAARSVIWIPLQTGLDVEVLAWKLARLNLGAPFDFMHSWTRVRPSIRAFVSDIFSFVPHAGEGIGPTARTGVWFSSQSGAKILSMWLVLPQQSWAYFRAYGFLIVHHHGNQFYLYQMKYSSDSEQSRDPLVCRKFYSTTALNLASGDELIFVDNPSSFNGATVQQPLEQGLTQVLTRGRQLNVGTHISLYSTLPENELNDVLTWLGDNRKTPVPWRCAYSLFALSASQSPMLFQMLEEDLSRGIFSWIFNLFGGSQSSPWAKIFRVVDSILEFVVPLLVTRSNGFAVQEIGPGWTMTFSHKATQAETAKLVSSLPALSRPAEDLFSEWPTPQEAEVIRHTHLRELFTKPFHTRHRSRRSRSLARSLVDL